AAWPFVLVEWNESTSGDSQFGQTLPLQLATVAPNNPVRLGKPSHLRDPIKELTTSGRRPCKLLRAGHGSFVRASVVAETLRSRSASERAAKIESAVTAAIKVCSVSGREHICGSFASHGRCSSRNLRPSTKNRWVGLPSRASK